MNNKNKANSHPKEKLKERLGLKEIQRFIGFVPTWLFETGEYLTLGKKATHSDKNDNDDEQNKTNYCSETNSALKFTDLADIIACLLTDKKCSQRPT